MMSFKTSLLLFVALAATTAAVPAAPPDPLMWLWQNAWPKSQQSEPTVPTPVARPKATRSKDHRSTHRKSPKTAKRKVWPIIKGVQPIPPIAKEERRGRVKVKTKARVSHCDALRERFAKIAKRRLLSCAEMKTARPCERPGDRAKASLAQKAKGAQCWAAGEL